MSRGRMFLFALCLFVPSRLLAQGCDTPTRGVELKRVEATADVWANIRKHEGSLRSETEQLLKTGEVSAMQSKPPEGMCVSGCSPALEPGFVLTTVPRKFLSGYDTEAACETKKAETEKDPFRREKNFSSLEELNEWFNDFSQGKGADGKALYKRCDGNCSPQYRTEIRKAQAGYYAEVSVLCGHARDKSDNKYELKLLAEWSCR